jgi:hypothetical protein
VDYKWYSLGNFLVSPPGHFQPGNNFLGGKSFITVLCNGSFLKISPASSFLYDVGLLVSLKGLCHEMNIFLLLYKVNLVLSVYALVVFKILFVKKIKCQVFTCFFENTY